MEDNCPKCSKPMTIFYSSPNGEIIYLCPLCGEEYIDVENVMWRRKEWLEHCAEFNS